jgi:hypothetical protein
MLILGRTHSVAHPEVASLQLDGLHERNESNRRRSRSEQDRDAWQDMGVPSLDFS